MKGKRTFKRFLAVVMAVVFTVTGITFTPREAKALSWTTPSEGWTELTTGNGDQWGAYWGSWGSNAFSYDNSTYQNISFKTGAPWQVYGQQFGLKASSSLVADTTYYYRITFHSSAAGTLSMAILSKQTDSEIIAQSVTAGDNVITGSKEYHPMNSDIGNLSFWMSSNGFPANTELTNISVQFSTTPITTPTEAPTQAPTQAPTEAPT